MEPNIEYRVRPVTRYVVTKYEQNEVEKSGSVRMLGEYDNEYIAQEVAYALCKADHERTGWSPGDTRIKYPDMKPNPNISEHIGA